MDNNLDSTDRSLGAYFLFTLAFIAFMVALAGILVSSPTMALCGGLGLVFAVWSFGRGPNY